MAQDLAGDVVTIYDRTGRGTSAKGLVMLPVTVRGKRQRGSRTVRTPGRRSLAVAP
ncbi:hypothetical protein GCM10010319_71200 [Streptomyces blastmyceticus]|uniref:Uncharacterized protein n=1 Tax=Streptomyces blastmyceticus TaxID=68180 RepID=A0ABN0Y421_9ACTN